MIDLDVFTPSDDRAVRLVVGKTADDGLAGPANGGDARTANIKPALTPKPNNDDFRRVPHLGPVA